MGGLLTLPVALGYAVSVLAKNGLFYVLCYSEVYVYFTIKELFQKKRLDLYDFLARGQPDKNGFFIPEKERKLETPLQSTSLVKNSDEVFIYGSNLKSEYLAVGVSRYQGDRVLCSLILKLPDGKTYTLPEEHALQTSTTEENTFGSSRLKIQCLLPMRKWRIFFNGILKERTNENEDFTYKHVKLTFIWTASSEIFDFSSDLSKTLLSHVIASSGPWNATSSFRFLNRLRKNFDCYEQPGMILGTIAIENASQQEMYLWGTRRRSAGVKHAVNYDYHTEIYASLKNGSLLYVCILNTTEKIKSFTFGYVMKPNGFIFPIDEIDTNIDLTNNETMNINCLAGKEWHEIKIKVIKTDSLFFWKEFGKKSLVRIIEISMNGKEGKGFVLKRLQENSSDLLNLEQIVNDSKLSKNKNETTPILSIPFEDQLCQKSELCGGKGSSLGNLFALSKSTKIIHRNSMFNVPQGLVVTTNAYKEFTKVNLLKLLKKFEKDVWTNSGGDIQLLCQKMVETVRSEELPESVATSIEKNLKHLFGDSFPEIKFAVRSSATGEDTEQMSAAGQMETFLGVKGIDEILHAVRKCWASQFTFQAVEYKRGYGQRLNTPMAVVIQEMINCEVAGVMFTCNPLTGDPRFVSITANWGLGESVVSASADPDEILLKRSYDEMLSIHSKTLGNKKMKIVMDEFGTKEVETNKSETSVCCISENEALRLGQIGVAIEAHYGSPRDIEWGIIKGNIFLFQSRPVTSLDVETDFETKHFFDAFQRTHNDIVTKANVGEVMPGATSPLGIDILSKVFDAVQPRRLIQPDRGFFPHKPYYQKLLVTVFNNMFIPLTSGFFKFKENNQDEVKMFIVALFGRLIDLKMLEEASADRFTPEMKETNKFLVTIMYLFFSFFAGKIAERRAKKIEKVRVPQDGMDPSELLRQIGNHYDLAVEGMDILMSCTFSSSFWNMSMLLHLEKIRGDWDSVLFSDFAFLLSTCTDVESADVPAAIQDIGYAISREIKPETFRKMSVQDALHWLHNNSSESGKKFKQFLHRHGHRCLKEFDVYTNTWESDPRSLIEMLQSLVNENSKISKKKEIQSFDSITSNLHVKLNFKERLKLRWLLPNARRGVREREFAKSVCIRMVDRLRKPLHKLSQKLVEEGILPRKELLFFLCIDEINQLIKTRSPKLVARATRRWKVQEWMDKLIFPEICIGIPKPIEDAENVDVSVKGFKMKGVPVSQGVVKSTARVVMNIKEAATIQPGDILITYSTDIGWSPYFPLLSGVVTELGGLISHGAVVAREYGLPCVVSLHGATKAFKSGDLVILDGNAGTLQRVESE